VFQKYRFICQLYFPFFSIYPKESRKKSGAKLIRCRVAEIRPNLLALIDGLQFGPFRKQLSIQRLRNQWQLAASFRLFGSAKKLGKLASDTTSLHFGFPFSFIEGKCCVCVSFMGYLYAHRELSRFPAFLCDKPSDIRQICEGQQTRFWHTISLRPVPLGEIMIR